MVFEGEKKSLLRKNASFSINPFININLPVTKNIHTFTKYSIYLFPSFIFKHSSLSGILLNQTE